VSGFDRAPEPLFQHFAGRKFGEVLSDVDPAGFEIEILDRLALFACAKDDGEGRRP
jgi:hypothetical protein